MSHPQKRAGKYNPTASWYDSLLYPSHHFLLNGPLPISPEYCAASTVDSGPCTAILSGTWLGGGMCHWGKHHTILTGKFIWQYMAYGKPVVSQRPTDLQMLRVSYFCWFPGRSIPDVNHKQAILIASIHLPRSHLTCLWKLPSGKRLRSYWQWP